MVETRENGNRSEGGHFSCTSDEARPFLQIIPEFSLYSIYFPVMYPPNSDRNSLLPPGKWCPKTAEHTRRQLPIDGSHCPKVTRMPFGRGLHNVSVEELVYELEEWKRSGGETGEEDEQVAKVLVLYTGGTIGMRTVDGGEAFCYYWGARID